VDEDHYQLSLSSGKASLAAAWLRGLSDGFIIFDEDLLKRIPGPFIVKPCSKSQTVKIIKEIDSANRNRILSGWINWI
jgi:glycine hydroxymethyltransferase